MVKEALLARTMVELADCLVDDFDVVDLMTLLSDRCVEMLDVQAAGVMLVSPTGELRVLASSSSTMRSLELFQEQADEGPCRDAFLTGRPVADTKLTLADGRWPRFSAQALAAGFQSAFALPMAKRPETIGALNLFRTERGELRQRDVTVAQGFADMATITLLQHRTITEARRTSEHLTSALNDCIVVEQATGVVSERMGLTIEQAASLLDSHATHHHTRPVDAARYVLNGSLTPEALDPAPD